MGVMECAQVQRWRPLTSMAPTRTRRRENLVLRLERTTQLADLC